MSALDLIPATGHRFIAAHDFVATEDGDLGFHKDDIIVATQTTGEGWVGRLESSGPNGVTGNFPANYVQPAEGGGGSAHASNAPTASETRFVANHAFHSSTEGDISFEKGDILIGTELVGEWWNGRHSTSGVTGLFPANYVSVADTEDHDPATTTSGHVRLRALHAFHSQEAGDLAFEKDDILIGMQKTGEWWTGKKEIGGSLGQFPANYVTEEAAPAEEAPPPATSTEQKASVEVAAEPMPADSAGASGDTDDPAVAETAAEAEAQVEAAAAAAAEADATAAADAAAAAEAEAKAAVDAEAAAAAAEAEAKAAADAEAAAAEAEAKAAADAEAAATEAEAKAAADAEAAAAEAEAQAQAAAAAEAKAAAEAEAAADAKAATAAQKQKEADAATIIQAKTRGDQSRARSGTSATVRSGDDSSVPSSAAPTNGGAGGKSTTTGGAASTTGPGGTDGDGETKGEDVKTNLTGNLPVELPRQTVITRDQLIVAFNAWDTDGDEVLTMKEFQVATDLASQSETTLPRLQMARLQRHMEKAANQGSNLDWQYWDVEEFISICQTPLCEITLLSDSKDTLKARKKRERSEAGAHLERRWAPKVEKQAGGDGTYLHTDGAVAITKDEFIERYHGTKEWEAAKKRVNPKDAKKLRDKMKKKRAAASGKSKLMSVDDLEQIRIRLRQQCTTHNGIEVGNIMPRRRWPMDRSTNPATRRKVTYEELREACKNMKSQRLATDVQFKGFWEYLQCEENDKCTYEELTRFVSYKPRRKVARKRSVALGVAEQANLFSNGFRPDQNKATAAFGSANLGSKSTLSMATDGGRLAINPVLKAFRQMLFEASWKEELLRDHFQVFDKDGDGTITRDEFRIGFESLSIPHSQEDLDLIIEVLDANFDDVIDYNEFTSQIFEDLNKLIADVEDRKRALAHEEAKKAEAESIDTKKEEIGAGVGADLRAIGDKPPEVPDECLMSIDDLEQIRIRLRQKCTTFRGIEVGEAFPRRKWPGTEGKDGDAVSYKDLRTDMLKIFPQRLGGVDGEWAFPSFWVYLATEEENFCTKDEFARFVSFVPTDHKVARKKSIVLGHAAVADGFLGTFRPDVNASADKSRQSLAKREARRMEDGSALGSQVQLDKKANLKESLSAADRRANIRDELNTQWEGADKSNRPPKARHDTKGQKNLGANLKAAAFGKKLLDRKLVRKLGDNKLDDSEIKMIKSKILAASYKKGGADLKKLFEEWDKDKNDYLDYGELASAVTKLMPKKAALSRKELVQLCNLFDVDGDGRISVVEFKQFVTADTYVSKRKKRHELEQREFVSQASLLKAQKGTFRAKSSPGQKKLASPKPKRERQKKALWRQHAEEQREDLREAEPRSRSNTVSSGFDEEAGSAFVEYDDGLGLVSGGTNTKQTQKKAGVDEDEQDDEYASDTEYDSEGEPIKRSKPLPRYDANGRLIRVKKKRRPKPKNSESLEEALKFIPPTPTPSVPSVAPIQAAQWFAESDSEEEWNQADYVRAADDTGARSAPRMTPVVKRRMRQRKRNVVDVTKYASSWDEPAAGMGGVAKLPLDNRMRTKRTVGAGEYNVPSKTRRKDGETRWFSETDRGARGLLDGGGGTLPSVPGVPTKDLQNGGGGGAGGDINVTLYRRQWDDQQPGDGTRGNPWRVAVNTSWTGEIAAPSWPTQQGTWVYVPNPPMEGEQMTSGQGLGSMRGVDTDGLANGSPRKRRNALEAASKAVHGNHVRQRSKVVYHPMQRLRNQQGRGDGGDSGWGEGGSHWRSEVEMRVPERPPTYNPEWDSL